VDVETVKESTLGEEIRDTDYTEITEQVTEATSFIDVELQEYGRKIEQQSNEHTDNAFRDKRAMMRREQEEAEAGSSADRKDVKMHENPSIVNLDAIEILHGLHLNMRNRGYDVVNNDT
jgi:hypothetical protein